MITRACHIFKFKYRRSHLDATYFKGTQMDHSEMVSLWCESLLTDTRSRVLYYRMKYV